MLSDRQGKLEFRARKPKYNRLKKERVENLLNRARVGNVRDGSWRMVMMTDLARKEVLLLSLQNASIAVVHL